MYTRIIIEPNTLCNRKCDFCINKLFKENVVLSEEILIKTMQEISNNINLFHKPLIFSIFKYNEPYLDISQTEHISKTIKDMFSDAYIYIHTNGDLLTEEMILNETSIDTVYVNDYDNLGIENILDKITNLGITNIIAIETNEDERMQIITKYNNTNYVFYVNSNIGNINYRNKCSTIYKHKKRDSNCFIKEKILTIDANGDIMACCDSSSYLHKDLIIGNIMTSGILNTIKVDEFKTKSCLYCDMDMSKCDVYGGMYNLRRIINEKS
ncbi:MAG: SPASM domain-containing protein [Anaeroplasmataceae bacterium]